MPPAKKKSKAPAKKFAAKPVKKGAAKAASKSSSKPKSAPKTASKPAARSAKKPAAKATAPVAASPAPAPKPAPKPKTYVPASKAEAFAIEAARLLHDDKCTDIVLLDVRGRNPMTDYLVIGSGTSDRQMRSTLHDVEDVGAKIGYSAVRSTSDDRATWLLADFMNVIVHLFEPNTRAHYDIEMMWGDAPRIPWERPGSPARDRAGLNAVEA